MFYLAENLKKYRAEKGLTQEEVAEALGVTPQSVSRWERGECCPDVLFLPALANLFSDRFCKTQRQPCETYLREYDAR